MEYSDLYVVRCQTMAQVELLLDFFDGAAFCDPCWETGMCICGGTSKGGVCDEPLCILFGAETEVRHA